MQSEGYGSSNKTLTQNKTFHILNEDFNTFILL